MALLPSLVYTSTTLLRQQQRSRCCASIIATCWACCRTVGRLIQVTCGDCRVAPSRTSSCAVGCGVEVASQRVVKSDSSARSRRDSCARSNLT